MNRPNHLLNSHANTLFGLITQAGLNPSDFQWGTAAHDEYSSGGRDMLQYKSPEAVFVFGAVTVLYRPGDEKLQDYWTAHDWQTTILYFVHWLDNIKRESTPSLWERITAGATLPAGALDLPHTPFTAREQAEILRRLEGMAEQVEALDTLTREQKQLFTAKLQELGNAVGRMDRGAWLDRAIGGVLAVLLATDVNHTVAASLLRWAVSMFHSAITGGAAPPLQLTP